MTIAVKTFGPVPFEVKDAEKGQVEAIFSTFNVKDKDGDWTLPGAFEDGAEVLIGAYGHSTWAGKPPVGKGVIKAGKKDARLLGQFFVETQAGHDHFAVVRHLGAMQQWSYGFDVKQTGELTDELEQKGVRRVLAKLVVHEVSPVLIGAGVGTRTISAKVCTTCGGESGATCGCRGSGMTPELQASADRAVAEFVVDQADMKAGRPPGIAEVPAYLVACADLLQEAADAGAQDLGLPPTRVRFFAGKSRPGLRGFWSPIFPDDIWVRADLGILGLATIGHEIMHRAQDTHDEPPDEFEARRYGERLAKSDAACWPWAVQPHVYG